MIAPRPPPSASGSERSNHRTTFLRPSTAPGRQFDVRAHQQLLGQIRHAIDTAKEQMPFAPDPSRVESRVQLLQRVLEDVIQQGEEAKLAASMQYAQRYITTTLSQIEKEEALKKQEAQREERVQAVLKDEREHWALLHKHRADVYDQRAAACAAKIEAQLRLKFEKGLTEEQRREEQLSARSRAKEEQARTASESARRRHLHQHEVLDQVKEKESQHYAERVSLFEKHRSEAAARLQRLEEQRALQAERRRANDERTMRRGVTTRVRTVRRGGQRVTTVEEDFFEKRKQEQEAAEQEAARRLEENRKEREAYLEFTRTRREQREEAVAARQLAMTNLRLSRAAATSTELQARESAIERIRSARRAAAEEAEEKLQQDVVEHVAKAEARASERLLSAKHAAFEKWANRADQLVAQTLQQYTEFATARGATATPRHSNACGDPGA